jgi:hypothetical protein
MRGASSRDITNSDCGLGLGMNESAFRAPHTFLKKELQPICACSVNAACYALAGTALKLCREPGNFLSARTERIAVDPVKRDPSRRTVRHQSSRPSSRNVFVNPRLQTLSTEPATFELRNFPVVRLAVVSCQTFAHSAGIGRHHYFQSLTFSRSCDREREGEHGAAVRHPGCGRWEQRPFERGDLQPLSERALFSTGESGSHGSKKLGRRTRAGGMDTFRRCGRLAFTHCNRGARTGCGPFARGRVCDRTERASACRTFVPCSAESCCHPHIGPVSGSCCTGYRMAPGASFVQQASCARERRVRTQAWGRGLRTPFATRGALSIQNCARCRFGLLATLDQRDRKSVEAISERGLVFPRSPQGSDVRHPFARGVSYRSREATRLLCPRNSPFRTLRNPQDVQSGKTLSGTRLRSGQASTGDRLVRPFSFPAHSRKSVNAHAPRESAVLAFPGNDHVEPLRPGSGSRECASIHALFREAVGLFPLLASATPNDFAMPESNTEDHVPCLHPAMR